MLLKRGNSSHTPATTCSFVGSAVIPAGRYPRREKYLNTSSCLEERDILCSSKQESCKLSNMVELLCLKSNMLGCLTDLLCFKSHAGTCHRKGENLEKNVLSFKYLHKSRSLTYKEFSTTPEAQKKTHLDKMWPPPYTEATTDLPRRNPNTCHRLPTRLPTSTTVSQ